MNYLKLNDNELVYLSNSRNEDALDIIIEKYKNVILGILKEYIKKYNIIGVEIADLYQEGLLGLLTAIENYDESRDVLFYTFATTCIRSSILSLLRRTFRNKSRILNNSCSLDEIIYDSVGNLYEIIKDEKNDPSNILLDKESQEELLINIKKLLSKSELIILDLRLKGLSNSEISLLLEKDKKYVENTLFRINKKYRNGIK